jgi:PAS domain S-box-containing protein
VHTIKRILLNGYAIGAFATAAILLVLIPLRAIFEGSPPVHLFLVAIMFAAWGGGTMPGLFTTALSVAASSYFLLEPQHSLVIVAPSETLRLSFFLAVGTLLSLSIARLRTLERRALRVALEREKRLKREIGERELAEAALLRAKEELEQRVAERTDALLGALQSLTEQARYLDAFFRHTITPLVFLDREFNFIRVNEAYARTCHRAVDDFPGHNHFEFYPSDVRAIFEEVVRTRLPHQAVAHPFAFPDHPDRGVTYWNWTLTPLLDEQGDVAVLVFALEDVTARRRAEIELEKHRSHLEVLVRERTQELEALNAQLEADIVARQRAERQRNELETTLTKIAASAPGVICSFRQRPDGTTCFPYTSPAVEEVLGLSPEALEKDAAPAFERVHPDDLGHLNATIADSARSLAPWHDEWRLRHPTKGEIWMEGRSVPEREPDGSILWYGFIHDVTERKRTEEALREADRRKNEFLAMLGHELRNPLAPVRNAVQIMRKIGVDDPRLAWARDIVARQTEHLARLVDDLLDVSRIVQGKLVLKKAPVELAAVIGPAVEASRPLLEQRRQAFALALPEQPIWIEGDDVRLAQVVSNLLNNAAKYTPEGGRISLEAYRHDGEAVIAVRDTGEGIPESLLPHIFKLFTQAERTLDRAQGGLGLGLTIVQNIVAMHGGRVEASSRGPGQGSEFVVRLPTLGHEPAESGISRRPATPPPHPGWAESVR